MIPQKLVLPRDPACQRKFCGLSATFSPALDRGDALDIGDIFAAGDESPVRDRLRAFRNAGATDLAVRVLTLGPDRDTRVESRKRTLAFLASLCPEF